MFRGIGLHGNGAGRIIMTGTSGLEWNGVEWRNRFLPPVKIIPPTRITVVSSGIAEKTGVPEQTHLQSVSEYGDE